MSSSRKLKFRTVPRAPRYPHNKHAEPVPLANKFQELVEQDELSPSQSRVPVQLPVNTAPTTSMAQRLEDLLAESASRNKRSSFDVDNDVQVRHEVQNEGNSSGVFPNLMYLHMGVLIIGEKQLPIRLMELEPKYILLHSCTVFSIC